MDINDLIAIVKKKLVNNINIESINIEDKTFLHKNHPGHDKKKFHLKFSVPQFNSLPQIPYYRFSTRYRL